MKDTSNFSSIPLHGEGDKDSKQIKGFVFHYKLESSPSYDKVLLSFWPVFKEM